MRLHLPNSPVLLQERLRLSELCLAHSAQRFILNQMNQITIDSEILGGIPVFTGTRVPVQSLFDYLESGDSLAEFLESFPDVPREQAVQVIEASSPAKTSDVCLRAPKGAKEKIAQGKRSAALGLISKRNRHPESGARQSKTTPNDIFDR